MELTTDEAKCRSLPPLLEGKIHGYLKLVIDEVVWSRRSPGIVTVLASWWGEVDSAQFRPADGKTDETRLEQDVSETYTIRTNLELFKEYLKNCETIELVVISEKNHQVVGTAQITELTNLLNGKSCLQYVPIHNDNGSRIGDIRSMIKFSSIQKTGRSPTKSDPKISLNEANLQKPEYKNEKTKMSFLYENDVPVTIKRAKQNENVYRSILKECRSDMKNVEPKSSTEVSDKLVAQVVARAQRLRSAILKETRDEDPLALSSSSIDSFRSELSANNEANLYQYFLGKKMSHLEEKKALNALRATSPTPSLIDLATETIKTCRDVREVQPENNLEDTILLPESLEQISVPEIRSVRSKEISPIDYVDSLRIAVESLTLTPAGYRRVRSSCVSRGDGVPLSVTYFVQYDGNFGNRKKCNRKIINESKPVKLTSKKQIGQIVYFNHEAVYDLANTYLHMDKPLKFKIFNRHLNQRTPAELGIGSMYVADAARARSLSSTQRLAIVNKGIKIGELKVTAQLGCDKIHFGKQFVEAITSAKENITVHEVSSNSSLETPRYKTATGGDSRKENSKPLSSSGTGGENPWNENTGGRAGREETVRRDTLREDDGHFVREESREDRENKILLHGLIHVAEGKELPSSSTYIICRGFWREDRSVSRVCEETSNPSYNLYQLVRLLHGEDLLERTRNNYIVIEVYSRTRNRVDELLGISKLPLHRLYLAYRDPQVLPHLLNSKYPVISVDEWIPAIHPVTGRICGQIRALVALGTAEQIAFLEMTRGLRNTAISSRDPSRVPDNQDARFPNHSNPYERSNQDEYENYQSDCQNDPRVTSTSCQTEITTVKYFKENNLQEGFPTENSDNRVLNVIVDRLAQALNVPKSINDQAAQTEVVFSPSSSGTGNMPVVEPLNLNPSTNNSFSMDSNSDVDSQRDRFLPSREIYRSVGVGAEFDDPVNMASNYGNTNTITIVNHEDSAVGLTHCKNKCSNTAFDAGTSNDRLLQPISDNCQDSVRSETENSSFCAVVEIECALHLPRVEKPDESVEPCTYVTFQRARAHNESQYGCYVVTNLYPFSCSPKWNWRCDTRLSNDLLENEEKRLILKVWRLVDPETSMEINFERDVVIGFSAIDVSVLTIGFPVVSGWFHVMDFTGKCNGQIQVSVTPLDNVSGFGKIACQPSTVRASVPEGDHSNLSSPYPMGVPGQSGIPVSGRSNGQETATNRHQVETAPVLDLGFNLGEASMSFLSLSLKKKLSELDEIKKRLQTRLQDVTNTAFDDDFDNDFDAPMAQDEETNNGNTEESRNFLRELENWEVPDERMENPMERGSATNGNRPRNFEDLENMGGFGYTSTSASTDANYTDTGYSTSSNVLSCRNVSNGNRYAENEARFESRPREENTTNGYNPRYVETGNLSNGHYPVETSNMQTNNLNARNHEASSNDDRSNCSIDDEPIRGTRVHISHLLDQLTRQLASVPPPTTNQPMKRNIMDLITSLRRNNNNFSNETKCNREVNVRTVPTQTEINNDRESPLTQMSNNPQTETKKNVISNERNGSGEDEQVKTQKLKVSSSIREELAADESNESLECDELSTQLIASNVRHMDVQSMLNPLLYPHLIPDVRANANGSNNLQSEPSSRAEMIERLDSRYAENFDAAVNNGLTRLRNLVENASTTSENDEIFRITPSGISENIDGNIDVTVIHKPCNDDLMASNSVDSTTTISLLDNDLATLTENDDDGSFNSTDTSTVSGVSRQAPDGGNPLEESSIVSKPPQNSQDSSSTS